MKRMQKNRKGQAIVEYIIIVVIVALGALTLMGMFSDTIQDKMAGVINTLGGVGGEEADEVSKGDSLNSMKELDSGGL